MSDDNEKKKEDVPKIPRHILMTIHDLLLQGTPIFEAYKEFCKILGDDVMKYNDFDFWWYRFLNGEFDLEYDRSKEPKKRELGDMPIKIFEKIVGKLEWMERSSLRKVSTAVRSVVDTTKFKLNKICVTLLSDHSLLIFDNHQIEYTSTLNGSNVQMFKKKKIEVLDEIHWKIALNDLGIVLKWPKIEVEDLEIHFGLNPEDDGCVEELFKSLGHQISVKRLICSRRPEKLTAVLPYLKPGILEEIELRNRDSTGCNIEGLVDFEQWKQAKKLAVEGLQYPSHGLSHFEWISVGVLEVSVENVVKLQNEFLVSPTFEFCHMGFWRSFNIDQLHSTIGTDNIPIHETKQSFMIQYGEECVIFMKSC